MKKILMALVIGLTITATACADDVISRNVNDLPAAARTVLNKQFNNTKVSYIKIDKDLFQSTSYEIQLVNGWEVSFDSKGNWTEVDCKKTGTVPAYFIPTTIKNTVKDMFPNERITKIEKDSREYEVELSNDVDLKFDKKGNLKEVD